jgi:hypothetical protein
LFVAQNICNTNLLPTKVGAIRLLAVSLYSWATNACLDQCNIVSAKYPLSQPPPSLARFETVFQPSFVSFDF